MIAYLDGQILLGMGQSVLKVIRKGMVVVFAHKSGFCVWI